MASRITIRDIARIALMSAVLLVVQVALAAVPNIELVSVLVMVFSLHFGRRALYAIYVFVLLEGIIYGFGMWWMSYLYVWAVLYIITRITAKNDHFLFKAVINGAFGLFFGAMTSIPYFITSGIAGGVSYFAAGIPFDILHCAGNFFSALILCQPLVKLLNKLDL